MTDVRMGATEQALREVLEHLADVWRGALGALQSPDAPHKVSHDTNAEMFARGQAAAYEQCIGDLERALAAPADTLQLLHRIQDQLWKEPT